LVILLFFFIFIIMTRIDKIEDKILNYQNEIIILTNIEEELWSYHPDNPNSIDINENYQKIKDQIYDLELKIEKIIEEFNIIKQEGDFSKPNWEGFTQKNYGKNEKITIKTTNKGGN
jgi:ABC-type Zn uptake system ZnuABC Zn-binding protein ZnuA